MEYVCYRRRVAAAKLLLSMLGLAGAAGLIYGALFGSVSLSVRIAAWAAALTGTLFFGSNLVLSFLALVRPRNVLFRYDESAVWSHGDRPVPWAQVKEITAEGARVGILFKPEFAKFLLRLEDGSRIEIRTYNAMTEREMKEWARRMRERKQAHDTAARSDSLRPDPTPVQCT
ncbi:MAG: YfjD family protein [Paenibacillus dendritiformis]|uniref:YfjD family protein n=1 Tax=Paenibacillus dendritiformis TaxID=130049 RepID=UPI00143CE3FF|nr:YfjD family protein [Paenibacillus dendritiformis]MDU5143620.1 YfjD family protein [Paenibacillus dendritiformis]NKI24702.1 YfjD family protein [Paenibacillus dendritiformis]NRG01546.1 hypothetical protein [Paenibacillus dendritiformis]